MKCSPHVLMLLSAVLLAGCSRPPEPEPERKPEPQAVALRPALQQPLDRARAVQQASDQAGDNDGTPWRRWKPGQTW